MSTEFALIRHATCALTASTLLGRIDTPIDASGHRQAEALAQRLCSERSAVLLSSPRLRACQTAAAIATRLRAPVIISNALDEIDFGAWSGRSFADLQRDASWRFWNEQRNAACTPCGESIHQIQQRVVQHLTTLAEQFNGWTVIVVTHAELIRVALMHYLQQDCGSYHTLEVSPASISRLRITGGTAQVLRVNEPCDA